MGWRRIFRASQSDCAATPAMWTGAAPIRRACDSRENEAWRLVRQTALCGPLIQKPVRDAAIAVNTAVAKERPVAADVFQVFQVTLADQDFFFVMRCLNNDASKRVAEERAAPEFQAFALRAIAADVAELLAYPVDHADKNTVGDGMSALNRAPCIMLHCAEFGFFIRMPADGRRIEKNISALKSGESCAFRIPLVPADQRAHAAELCIEGLESKIARRKVKLLIIKRVVWNVHLAVEPPGASI